jgi:hypothetical protein
VVPAVIAAGLANVTVCQPDADSPLNVAWRTGSPAAVQSEPTCVPVFAAAL